MNNIAFKKGFKYQLAETYEIMLSEYKAFPGRDILTPFVRFWKDGKLVILDGYAWDGPSGPAIDTTNFMRGSLIHDVLYQLIRLGHLDPTWRNRADEVLREICIEDGMSTARAWWVYTSVKTFAQRAARPSSEPQIFRAP